MHMGKSLGSIEPTARDWPFVNLFLPQGWRWWVCLLLTSPPHPPFWFHSHFRINTSQSALLQSREQSRIIIRRAMSQCGFVLTGVFLQFLAACFRWGHRYSSWKWREEEVQGLRCFPGLFECGAWGRDRWPTAARPHGPPCDKPGNVEWRPRNWKRG